VTAPVEVPAQEEVPPVSDDNTPETEAPKRGRKPNVVGKANAEFLKARARLDKAQKRADKVQSVQDELDAAKAEYAEKKAAYETAFRASLGLTDDVADDDDTDEDGDE
jgi:predicted transcriptional regulator